LGNYEYMDKIQYSAKIGITGSILLSFIIITIFYALLATATPPGSGRYIDESEKHIKYEYIISSLSNGKASFEKPFKVEPSEYEYIVIPNMSNMNVSSKNPFENELGEYKIRIIFKNNQKSYLLTKNNTILKWSVSKSFDAGRGDTYSLPDIYIQNDSGNNLINFKISDELLSNSYLIGNIYLKNLTDIGTTNYTINRPNLLLRISDEPLSNSYLISKIFIVSLIATLVFYIIGFRDKIL
jgi:hypothetical protein